MQLFYIFIFVWASFSNLSAINESDGNELSLDSQDELFVSLGSVCEPAHMLRYNNLRNYAFPFDWIVSFDIHRLVQILKDDFLYFKDEAHLACYGGGGGHLYNTHYWLEFLHDGDWNGDGFKLHMPPFQEKYQRRIARFRNLNNYQGKVFFLRGAYTSTLSDPHRYFRCEENLEISEENAFELYHALKEYFPNLDFTLVIINKHIEVMCAIEKNWENKLMMVRIGWEGSQEDQISQYGQLFQQIQEASNDD